MDAQGMLFQRASERDGPRKWTGWGGLQSEGSGRVRPSTSVRRRGCSCTRPAISPNARASIASREALHGGRRVVHTTRATCAPPESEGESSLVSTELRSCGARLEARSWIASLSQWSDLLIVMPWLTAAALEFCSAASEPARSISVSVADVASRNCIVPPRVLSPATKESSGGHQGVVGQSINS